MRKIISIVILTAIVGCSSTKKLTLEKLNSLQTLEATTKLITELSSDEMEGRKPGTPGMEKATVYVENFLKSIQVEPYYNDSYRDTVNLYGSDGYNIVGVIKSKKASDEFILLGAHLDHLGKSLRNTTDSVFNGANDNASGVTTVLEMARVLKKYNFDKNIIVALFTAEEMGLIGSEHLAKRLKNENVNLKYALIFDMVGSPYIQGKPGLYISGEERSNLGQELKNIVGNDFLLPFQTDYFDVFYLSDNFPFYSEFKIPSHTFCTYNFKNFDQYHKLSDDIKVIDFKYLNNVIHTTTLAVVKLLQNNSDIVLTEKNE